MITTMMNQLVINMFWTIFLYLG